MPNMHSTSAGISPDINGMAPWQGQRIAACEYAVVHADGFAEEMVDGAGLRRLAANPGLTGYAAALLTTARQEARFLWIDEDGGWLTINLKSGFLADRPCVEITLLEVEAPFGLSPRELDVLTLVSGGLSNEQIAASLGASPRTVAKHVENMLAKMELGSRAAAAGVAVEEGLLRLPTPGGRPLLLLAIGDLESAVAGRGQRRTPAGLPPKRPIIVGSPHMVAGLGRFDADEMHRGASLAIAEINAAGGVAGRKIELLAVDCCINDVESLTQAYRTFLDAEVDAIATGYSGAEAQLQDMVVDYGCPYLHASTSDALVRRVREDPGRYSSVFQVCPSDIHYGPALAGFLEGLEQRGEWKPRNRRAVAVTSSNWTGLDLGVAELGFLLGKRGWQVDAFEGLDPGMTDWSQMMEAIRGYDPAVIFLGFAFPTASISFQKAFLAAPTRSLIYTMYSPSIPVFREELGDLANGVLWATTTGIYSDAIGLGFARRYHDRYGVSPGRSHAGIAYDRVRLLANAWSRTGNPRSFARVAEDLRSFVHRGVNGSYFLGSEGQSALAYGNHTPDPSISQAHLVFQIQRGQQRILSPQPYVDGRFELPWWFENSVG